MLNSCTLLLKAGTDLPSALESGNRLLKDMGFEKHSVLRKEETQRGNPFFEDCFFLCD